MTFGQKENVRILVRGRMPRDILGVIAEGRSESRCRRRSRSPAPWARRLMGRKSVPQRALRRDMRRGWNCVGLCVGGGVPPRACAVGRRTHAEQETRLRSAPDLLGVNAIASQVHAPDAAGSVAFAGRPFLDFCVLRVGFAGRANEEELLAHIEKLPPQS